MTQKIKLGVSTCLLGEKVRYDGGHKLDRYITNTLGQYMEYVPVCPEVECGLPIPRESMRLVGDVEEPKLVTTKTGIDHTERMKSWGEKKLAALEKENLCGYIFKSKSPSSGMERVRVYGEKGMPNFKGVGIWAKMFMDRFPLLPVEEEGRLHDPKLREMFIERIFVYKRWREDVEAAPDFGRLLEFHTRHKYLIMSHSPDWLKKLGRLIAGGGKEPIRELVAEYLSALAKALGYKTTIKKNVNVLHHIMGYFKKDLTADEKREFLELVDHYAREHIPLIVPVTMLNHYVRKYDEPYLREQYYLNPHPIELMLRN